MAEEQPKITPVEAENTTAPETATEATTEAPKPATEGTEEPITTGATSTEVEDVEMKDEGAAASDPQATTEVANPPSDAVDTAVTPSSNKNTKRKSGAGVPEHKNKKLNKKKSMAQLNLDVKPGDYYWARLKGYPPWPAIVCDEEMLPEILLGTRPVSAQRTDGSYREDFADGGKNAKDRTYPVMFLGTNEFCWMVNTSLTKLEEGDCAEDKQTGKITKALKEAYNVANEGHDLDHFKEMLNEFMETQKLKQEEEANKQAEKEAKAAKKAEKAEKAEKPAPKEKKDRRKSKSKETISDEDEMEIDVSEEVESKPPSKKRKKAADSEGEDAKPKKTPKSLKITAPKANGESTKKPAKAKKTVSKPEEEQPNEPTLTEAEKLERREKAVLYLRHRLQKGFLMRDQAPKEDEMPGMADFFTQLEAYDNLESSIIRSTKIYKVLRGIIKLSSIPREEEFDFKKRSSDLLASWNDGLGSSKDDDKENGDKTEEIAEKEETKEPSAAPVESTELGNDAVDDKDVAMTDSKEDEPEVAKENEATAVAPADAEVETTSA